MEWTQLHGTLLAQAFRNVLGQPQRGAMAFVRCMTPSVIEALATDASFAPKDWDVHRVADETRDDNRTITADLAVELRESKTDATLLLVDTDCAGAGMDGIYSAAREVSEAALFKQAHRLAAGEITRRLSKAKRQYAEQAVKRARRHGGIHAVSRWAEFDFLCRVADGDKTPGAYLHLLGLWPVLDSDDANASDNLNTSTSFVNRLLGTAGASLAPAARIDAVRLDPNSEREPGDLERFLHAVDTKPVLTALGELAERKHLWVGALRPEQPAVEIRGIELTTWRNRNGKIAKWSGLIEEGEPEDPPSLILRHEQTPRGRDATLEVRWKTDPTELAKNAAEYRIMVLTDMDEELAVQEVSHSARKGGERCRFSSDDFSSLDEETLISAKVIIEVVGNSGIERDESEEFRIRFGEPVSPDIVGVGATVRTFSDGLAELRSREIVSSIVSSPSVAVESKGFVTLRTPVEQRRRKSFRVYRPPLIAEAEQQWIDGQGAIGRWTVKVRGTGQRAGTAIFEPFEGRNDHIWQRAKSASRRLAERFNDGGGVAQVYDDKDGAFSVVREYLRAWAALLEQGDPSLALASTVEIQSLSGRTIGLIVLPAHPLRVAWHVAYDSLVLDTAFEQEQRAKDILREFASLDGAMFPAFLPNPNGNAFVFADTLGFHAVGMVPDSDNEPKAAVALLARALGDGEAADTAPTVGSQSAKVLGDEIAKYLECHKAEDAVGNPAYASRLLHIHALRAGDGFTVARALGGVYKRYYENDEAGYEEGVEEPLDTAPVFSLDLYPSRDQRGVAGRFIAEARERRRSGAGVLALEDRWMLESRSLPGGVNMPRLRWARKDKLNPNTAAHVAIAFDTFESSVEAMDDDEEQSSRPYHAFGLLSFFERRYASRPVPVWTSTVPPGGKGEKHPSSRIHTEALLRIQNAVQSSVARHIGAGEGLPVLKTEVFPEKADSLATLHRLCDWVVTLDRNAGIEYFDSPADNRDIYDAYVIDCVPEREDIGCLQLITSTANLDEVRTLLDHALDRMGLSRSRRNAEFLLGHLKALSGRLAIRLTGHRPATSELIALAVSHANCRHADANDDCWLALEYGFVVPVDDVRDLIPPIAGSSGEDGNANRPDIIYVTTKPRKGLVFRFVEVKYRRHLRTARAPELLEQIRRQTKDFRSRWERGYDHEMCSGFRAIRRAKLARVLRFYADKARRHNLPENRHTELISEIERMIERGGDYAFAPADTGDRGWVFCPEYMGYRPLKISPDDWSTEVFLFGPGLLPDTDGGYEQPPPKPEHRSIQAASGKRRNRTQGTSTSRRDNDKIPNVDTHDPMLGVKSMQPFVRFGIDTLTNTEVKWTVSVKGNPHLLIAGLPGMGKTTCLVNMCKQLVESNIRPIVFSYHQDIDENLEKSLGKVHFVDFDGLAFNPLQVIDRESRTAHLDVAGAMRDIFAAIYPELGDIQASHIRIAIKDSFEEVGWGTDAGVQEPVFRRFVEILRDKPKPNRGLRTLLERLEELDDYGFFDTDANSQGSLWSIEGPSVVRIHTTQNEMLQRAFAFLVFYSLYKDMFRRGIHDRITHALVIDEAHRAARLKLIPTMAKECRKYGISLVLASQEARDFDVSVFSAIANYLILRSTDADAKFLVRNVSTSRQERALIDKIKEIRRFRALYFSEGSRRPSQVALSP